MTVSLYPTGDEAFVLSMWIWVPVSYLPDTATGYNHSVTLSQGSILPHNKLSVCCIAELFVALPCVLNISHCPDIVPDPSCKAQDPLLQNIHFHVWKAGNTGVMRLPTALPFHICGHFSAVMAETPTGLTFNRRARWRRIWCEAEEVKHQTWVPCQAELQQLMGLL